MRPNCIEFWQGRPNMIRQMSIKTGILEFIECLSTIT